MKSSLPILFMLFFSAPGLTQSSNVQVRDVTVSLDNAAIQACASKAKVPTDVDTEPFCVLPLHGLGGHTVLSILSSSNPKWSNFMGLSVAAYEDGCVLRVVNDNNQLLLLFTAGVAVTANECIRIDNKLDQSLVKRVRSLSFKVLVQ